VARIAYPGGGLRLHYHHERGDLTPPHDDVSNLCSDRCRASRSDVQHGDRTAGGSPVGAWDLPASIHRHESGIDAAGTGERKVREGLLCQDGTEEAGCRSIAVRV